MKYIIMCIALLSVTVNATVEIPGAPIKLAIDMCRLNGRLQEVIVVNPEKNTMIAKCGNGMSIEIEWNPTRPGAARIKK